MKYFIPNPCDEKNRDREDFELACVMDHVSPTIMKYVNDLKRYSTYSKSIEIAKNVPTIIKIFWRVSEELTNKLIIFTIFAVAIYEVSIINFILLFFPHLTPNSLVFAKLFSSEVFCLPYYYNSSWDIINSKVFVSTKNSF